MSHTFAVLEALEEFYGADGNTQGWQRIHIHARRGEVHALRSYIEFGEDTDIRDGEDETPLHHAVRGGKLQTVRILLDHGVEFDAMMGSGWSAMHLVAALTRGRSGALIIIEGASVTAPSCSGPALIIAALIAEGASVTRMTRSGHMPAEVIYCDHRWILPILFGAGAPLPRIDHAAWMRQTDTSRQGVPEMIAARLYVERIAAVGGWDHSLHTSPSKTVSETLGRQFVKTRP